MRFGDCGPIESDHVYPDKKLSVKAAGRKGANSSSRFYVELTPSRKGASEPPEDAESVLGDLFSDDPVQTDRKVDQLTKC
ncbi:hypothetical protein pipiens_016323 [Culex pipiens pipiens]|uniref:Uncharacterized protein n=1 Tax=Culex pipiens pipiens TaxID=38569 RepID=A0ABD1CN53_CULPP